MVNVDASYTQNLTSNLLVGMAVVANDMYIVKVDATTSRMEVTRVRDDQFTGSTVDEPQSIIGHLGFLDFTNSLIDPEVITDGKHLWVTEGRTAGSAGAIVSKFLVR